MPWRAFPHLISQAVLAICSEVASRAAENAAAVSKILGDVAAAHPVPFR
jgi:hypothetical protein